MAKKYGNLNIFLEKNKIISLAYVESEIIFYSLCQKVFLQLYVFLHSRYAVCCFILLDLTIYILILYSFGSIIWLRMELVKVCSKKYIMVL